MKIKTLTLKNFLSCGNVTQAINLNEEHLTLVLGENLDADSTGGGNRNGSGKSSILHAISYALFGVGLTAIKKDNLINKQNSKNMLVTLTFDKDGNSYRIERGRRPTVLRFFINDKEQVLKEVDDAQGDMRETQKDLDKLLGMSHDMFKHIVALNTYTEPFLSLRAFDQRAIIEQLLGITLLSEKSEVLREQIRETKEAIVQENANLEATKKSNEKIQHTISSLEMRQTVWHKQVVEDCTKIQKSIAELQSIDIKREFELHELLTVTRERMAKIASLNKEKSTIETAISKSDKEVVKYSRELEQLLNKTCPSCEQELHTHKHVDMTSIAENNLTEAKQYQDALTAKYNDLIAEISDVGELTGLPTTYYDSLDKAHTHQNNLNSLEEMLKRRQNDKDPYQEQIDELTNTALQEVNWDAVNELNKLKDHQEFLLKLLTNKDSFIRKKIIDQNLSYLNTRLTQYIDKMGLPHQVTFLNDLSVEITQLGQDLDFYNLSRGESTRLILSLSWAFRDVWENLYQNINLLFIDELIDNGLDASGTENALSILKKMTRDQNKNVFLISHKEELVGRVNNVLKAIKENNFTNYEVNTENV